MEDPVSFLARLVILLTRTFLFEFVNALSANTVALTLQQQLESASGYRTAVLENLHIDLAERIFFSHVSGEKIFKRRRLCDEVKTWRASFETLQELNEFMRKSLGDVVVSKSEDENRKSTIFTSPYGFMSRSFTQSMISDWNLRCTYRTKHWDPIFFDCEIIHNLQAADVYNGVRHHLVFIVDQECLQVGIKKWNFLRVFYPSTNHTRLEKLMDGVWLYGQIGWIPERCVRTDNCSNPTLRFRADPEKLETLRFKFKSFQEIDNRLQARVQKLDGTLQESSLTLLSNGSNQPIDFVIPENLSIWQPTRSTFFPVEGGSLLNKRIMLKRSTGWAMCKVMQYLEQAEQNKNYEVKYLSGPDVDVRETVLLRKSRYGFRPGATKQSWCILMDTVPVNVVP